MIPVKQLKFKLEERLNKLSSNGHQGIETQQLLTALDEASVKLIKQKIGLNNVYRIGIDGFKKRYQDLQNLIVPHTNIPVTKTTSHLNSYSAPIPSDTLIPIHGYIVASKNGCTDRIVNISQIIPHSDLTLYLNSPNHNPSFEYQETIAEITNNELLIYNGDFTIDELHFSYLRLPVKLEIAGVPNINGISTTTVDCELAEYLEDELLDLAHSQIAMNTENINQVQFSQQNQKNSE